MGTLDLESCDRKVAGVANNQSADAARACQSRPVPDKARQKEVALKRLGCGNQRRVRRRKRSARAKATRRAWLQAANLSYLGIFWRFNRHRCRARQLSRQKWGTHPYLLMVGVVPGIATGFNELWRVAKRYQKQLKQNRERPNPNPSAPGEHPVRAHFVPSSELRSCWVRCWSWRRCFGIAKASASVSYGVLLSIVNARAVRFLGAAGCPAPVGWSSSCFSSLAVLGVLIYPV